MFVLKYHRNDFEVVSKLCVQIAYGNLDSDCGGAEKVTEIIALENTAVKFGPSFPVKAYSKVCNSFGNTLNKNINTFHRVHRFK